MRSRLLVLSIVTLAHITAAAAQEIVPMPDGFAKATIQQAYDELVPATCVLRYSMEITNPGNGEVTRRSAHTLGLLVSSDGMILAHGHLLLDNRKPKNIKVTIGEDEDNEYDATLLTKPDDINVTFLRIEAKDGETFPFVSFKSRSELELGESFMLIGLLRESLDYARGLQMRRIGAILEKPRLTYALDESTAFGYVGAPVIDTEGDVVGVLGFDLSSNEGGDIYTRSGHPLIFQADLFQQYIDTPPSEESVTTDAWLGVFTQPLTDDLAEYWDVPHEGGVVVATVLPGSPADKSGLRMGDIIVNFDGNPITVKQDQDVVAFTKLVRESPLEEPLSIKLLREGEAIEMRLSLRQRPKSGRDADEYEDDIFGLTARELTTDVRIRMNLAEELGGVLVRRVKSGSPAAVAGIRPGFVIMAIGGRPIASLDGYVSAVKAEQEAQSSEITLFCQVGASTAFFRLQPRWEN